MAWFVGRAAHAGPLVVDAVGVARGGQSVLGGIDASPASPRASGWRLRIDAFEPWPGIGLVAASAAAEWAGPRLGVGLAYGTLWSPVGVVREFAAGAQLRRAGLVGGCGIQSRAYEFAGYPTIWESTPRAGVGWRGRPEIVLATVIERIPGPVAHPRLRAALEVRLLPAVRVAVEIEREPGVEARTIYGMTTGAAPLRFLAGFDVATQSWSIGFAWSEAGQGVAWGARTHPVLGWSHAWTYEYAR